MPSASWKPLKTDSNNNNLMSVSIQHDHSIYVDKFIITGYLSRFFPHFFLIFHFLFVERRPHRLIFITFIIFTASRCIASLHKSHYTSSFSSNISPYDQFHSSFIHLRLANTFIWIRQRVFYVRVFCTHGVFSPSSRNNLLPPRCLASICMEKYWCGA